MRKIARGARGKWILLGAFLVVMSVLGLAFWTRPREFRLSALESARPVESWSAVDANVDTEIYSFRREFADVSREVKQELQAKTSRWSAQTDKGRLYLLRTPDLEGDEDVNYVVIYRGQWTVRPGGRSVEAISKEQRAWTTIYVYHRYNKLTWLAKKWHAATRAMGIR
jgi:hypothetical protein